MVYGNGIVINFIYWAYMDEISSDHVYLKLL